ncbi:hypothetical protein LQW54_001156 [Pestalotiopsis sp. IQ-011]
MAPHFTTGAAIAPRSNDMSGGAIAGAVIGSFFGFFFLSLVLGFLYFRWKRGSRPVVGLDDDDKPSEIERRLSLPGPDHTAAQAPFTQAAYGQPWPGDDGQDPAWAQDLDGQEHEPSGNNFGYANIAYQHGGFVQEPDSISNPGEGEIIEQSEFVPRSATHDGGAADYYDTSVPMDSEPEQESTPNRQMTDLYEEQLRKARESRKNSKGSAWSRFSKGLMSKRKRSTRVSELTMEEGHLQTASPTTSHPDVAMTTVEGDEGNAASQDRNIADGELYDEPQEMSDSSRPDEHTNKKTKRRGPSGDASGVVPHRLDSLRRDSTHDSLPSTALRQIKPTPLRESSSAVRQPTRFQSPELQGPMEMDDYDHYEFVGADTASAVRGSHSPPSDAPGYSAVNPMDIMRPSNAAEKAVFTNAELIRIASVSASPPASPPYNTTPPSSTDMEHNISGDSHEDAHHADESGMDDSEQESEDEEMADEPQYLQPPQITVENAFITDGTSDWSTPGGATTMTNASSGRTPVTDITCSPSPAPSAGLQQADSSASPPDSATSPKLVLVCEECGRNFDQIHKLNHHKRYHDRKHSCPYDGCDKKFGTKTHLDRHVNDKHEKTKGFHCTVQGCQYFTGGKLFPRKDNWKRHMVNKHNIHPTFDPPLVE